MRFLLIILLYLSADPSLVISQDLEEVTPTKHSNQQLDPSQNGVVGEPHIITQKESADVKIDTSQIEVRAADTYRKEEYLNKLLRQTYYQKITTSDWSKYLNPDSWKKNVLKWRYLSQLKNYITGNNQEIIVIRSNTDPKIEEPVALVADSLRLTDTLIVHEDALAQTDISLPEESQLTNDVIAHPSPKKIDDNQRTAPPAPEAKEEESVILAPTKAVQKAPEKQITTAPTTPAPPKKTPPPPKSKPQNTNAVIVTPPILQGRSIVNKDFFSKKGNLPWPVRRGSVTGGFGIRKNAEARGLRPENYGIDMVCPGGTVVSAVYDGTVLMAKRQSPYDFIVTVKHGDFTSAHYYLITTYVTPGDVVSKGQALGQLRTSVSEADFHFEIWNNQDRVNPELWLKSR